MGMQAAPAPIICPVCKGENPADAVFCGNAECHKALGEFRYVIEELAAQSTSLERLADKVTAFTGRPHFVTVHVLWFLRLGNPELRGHRRRRRLRRLSLQPPRDHPRHRGDPDHQLRPHQPEPPERPPGPARRALLTPG